MNNFVFQILVSLLSIALSFFSHALCPVLFSSTESSSRSKKLPYQSAKEYIQTLEIKTQKEFKEWSRLGKRPKNIPSNPNIYYGEQWESWGEFLGTKRTSTKKRKWRDYALAKEYVQLQGIKTRKEFIEWSQSGKKPEDIPSNPNQVYQTEWEGWGEFLETGRISDKKRKWRDYTLAKKYVQSQRIKTQREFQKWSQSGKRPEDIPSHPDVSYGEQWESWGEFLKTRRISNNKREWREYSLAKEYVQLQGIKTRKEFIEWSQSGEGPEDIPSRPDRSYGLKWEGWDKFLGTGRKVGGKRKWRDYLLAKEYVQSQGIKTREEFREWSRSGEKPEDIPSSPDEYYRTQWESWGEFLGTGRKVGGKRKWRDYSLAREYIQLQGIKTREEFIAWARSGKRPEDIPFRPDVSYGSQWEGWKEFFGTHWMSFERAQSYIVRTEKITEVEDFIEWLKSEKRPNNFPSEPHKHYSEWKSAKDFLKIKWMPYSKLKLYVQSMEIETKEDFFKWVLEEHPEGIPANPGQVYKKEWKGWEKFLGLDNLSQDENLSTSLNGNKFGEGEIIKEKDFLEGFEEDQILKEDFLELDDAYTEIYE